MNESEQKIDDLKNSLRKIMQLIVQRGKPLEEELKIKLVQVMQHISTRIDESRQEGQQQNELEQAETEQEQIADQVAPVGEVNETPSSSRQSPQVDAAPHESSNINGFRYDPQTQKLLVKFQDKYPSQNGPVYEYDEVPPYIYDIFSRGAVAPKTSGKNAWHRWRKGKAPSHGASMYALIKQAGYKYRKVG